MAVHLRIRELRPASQASAHRLHGLRACWAPDKPTALFQASRLLAMVRQYKSPRNTKAGLQTLSLRPAAETNRRLEKQKTRRNFLNTNNTRKEAIAAEDSMTCRRVGNTMAWAWQSVQGQSLNGSRKGLFQEVAPEASWSRRAPTWLTF